MSASTVASPQEMISAMPITTKRELAVWLLNQFDSNSILELLRGCLQEHYAREPFVRVYGKGQPELRCVQHTNQCHVAVAASGPLVVVTSVIDNLQKGASGQALQNMNLMLGLPEGDGLS